MNCITRWKVAKYAFPRVFCVDPFVTIVRKWMAAREEIFVKPANILRNYTVIASHNPLPRKRMSEQLQGEGAF